MLLHYGWLRIEKKTIHSHSDTPFFEPRYLRRGFTKNSQQQSIVLAPGAASDAMHYSTVQMDVQSCLVAKPDEGAVGLLNDLSFFSSSWFSLFIRYMARLAISFTGVGGHNTRRFFGGLYTGRHASYKVDEWQTLSRV